MHLEFVLQICPNHVPGPVYAILFRHYDMKT